MRFHVVMFLPLVLLLLGIPADLAAVDSVSGVVAYGPTIVMLGVSSVDEEPELWWSLRSGEFAARGYRVEKRVHSRLRVSPTFRVYRDGKWHTREGWLLRHHLTGFFGSPIL